MKKKLKKLKKIFGFRPDQPSGPAMIRMTNLSDLNDDPRRNHQATVPQASDIRTAPSSQSNLEQASVGETSGIVSVSLNSDTHQFLDTEGRAGESTVQQLSIPLHHYQRAGAMDPARIRDNQASHSGGLFSNASGFNIFNPILVDHVKVPGSAKILEKMKVKHGVVEAEFDSSDRERAPRCQPGTRTRFLAELKERIKLGTRITWLFGPAGVGKSAIMQTLAETLSTSVICLSFFFSRLKNRNDPNKLFPTLSYRLATACDTYRQYIEGNLVRDPDFLAKTLDEQFKRLFIHPIGTKRMNNFPHCVVILDGLDEVQNSQAQTRILDLIQDFVQHHKINSFPIFWVIASRSEPHIQASFSRIQAKIPDDFWKLEIPIDSAEAKREVETYINAALLRIREDFLDILPDHWPPKDDRLKIVTTSSGLFAFATTCMAYIGDQNPVERLNDIISLINHYEAEFQNARPKMQGNPFEALDLLYRNIMESTPVGILPIARAFLGFHLLRLEVARNPPFIFAYKTLGYSQTDAYVALRGFHAVICCPHRNDSATALRFLHPSFTDFLRDKSRSREHWIDMGEEIRKVWRCYVGLFRQFSQTELPDLIPLENHKCYNRVWGDALLRNHCQNNWLSILTTHCHALPCNCGISPHLVLDTTELVDVFKEFSPILFCPELQFVFEGHDIVGWLFGASKHAPPALLEHVYQHTMTLDEFSESDFDCVFRGLISGRSAGWQRLRRLSKLNTKDLGIIEWGKIKDQPVTAEWDNTCLLLQDDWRLLGDLMHLEKEHGMRYKVRIFGVRGGGLWVMVSGQYKISGHSSDCLVFPYAQDTHDS